MCKPRAFIVYLWWTVSGGSWRSPLPRRDVQYSFCFGAKAPGSKRQCKGALLLKVYSFDSRTWFDSRIPRDSVCVFFARLLRRYYSVEATEQECAALAKRFSCERITGLKADLRVVRGAHSDARRIKIKVGWEAPCIVGVVGGSMVLVCICEESGLAQTEVLMLFMRLEGFVFHFVTNTSNVHEEYSVIVFLDMPVRYVHVRGRLC